MKRTLVIGALEPDIAVQLKGLISADDAQLLDLDKDALVRCMVRGYISDTQFDRAGQRLIKKCQKAVKNFRAIRRNEAQSFWPCPPFVSDSSRS